VFEEKLGKIEDSMSRKQLYNIMFDMLKHHKISGAQLLDICTKQMQGESAQDVIADVLRFVIPSCIKSYIPLDMYMKYHNDIFELLIDGILSSGTIKGESTQHLIFDSALISARNEAHLKLLVDWYESGKVANTKGKEIQGFTLSLKQKHSMIRRIWASATIPLEKKQALLDDISKTENSDWIE